MDCLGPSGPCKTVPLSLPSLLAALFGRGSTALHTPMQSYRRCAAKRSRKQQRRCCRRGCAIGLLNAAAGKVGAVVPGMTIRADRTANRNIGHP